MKQHWPTMEQQAAYQARLMALRVALGLSQTEFAKVLGISMKKWNHYERGFPLSRETAFLIKQHFPFVSLEWIWFG